VEVKVGAKVDASFLPAPSADHLRAKNLPGWNLLALLAHRPALRVAALTGLTRVPDPE